MKKEIKENDIIIHEGIKYKVIASKFKHCHKNKCAACNDKILCLSLPACYADKKEFHFIKIEDGNTGE